MKAREYWCLLCGGEGDGDGHASSYRVTQGSDCTGRKGLLVCLEQTRSGQSLFPRALNHPWKEASSDGKAILSLVGL